MLQECGLLCCREVQVGTAAQQLLAATKLSLQLSHLRRRGRSYVTDITCAQSHRFLYCDVVSLAETGQNAVDVG